MRDHPGMHFILVGHIDATVSDAVYGWEPIPYFNGTFDGNDFAISNLFINRPTEDYVCWPMRMSKWRSKEGRPPEAEEL